MDDLIWLRGAGVEAAISPRGAELQSWSVGGVPLLWKSDPAFWAETAPLLFPVVGWTRGGIVRVDGQTYPLGLHGFARSQMFALSDHSDQHATFVLEENPETLALYPFAFALEVTYRLEGRALLTQLRVENHNCGSMPYAVGLHPGFCWPLAGGDVDAHRIVFDAHERPEVPRITQDGLFSSERRAVALNGHDLPLAQQTFAQEALCFLDANSHGLTFESGQGAVLRVELEDFPHIALWSRPGAPFVCIEAWTGYGDPEGFAGELADKPSMRLLEPGQSAQHGARFAFDAG